MWSLSLQISTCVLPMLLKAAITIDSIIIDVQEHEPDESEAKPLPGDCLLRSLEYLHDERDLESIRKTSVHCNKVHHRYKQQQWTKFDILESIIPDDSHRIKYWRIEDVLQSAPMFPGIYVDFESNDNIMKLHNMQNDHIRGLNIDSNLPFVSLRLWSASQSDNTVLSALLICHFDFDGMRKVNIHWKKRNDLESQFDESTELRKSRDQSRHFGFDELNRVLSGEQTIQMMCDHGAGPTLWYMDKRRRDSSCARCHSYPVVMHGLCVVLTGFLIYLVFAVA